MPDDLSRVLAALSDLSVEVAAARADVKDLQAEERVQALEMRAGFAEITRLVTR